MYVIQNIKKIFQKNFHFSEFCINVISNEMYVIHVSVSDMNSEEVLTVSHVTEKNMRSD